MWGLRLRMWLLWVALFAIIYGVIVFVGTTFMQVTDFSLYLVISLVMMLVQYFLGPKVVEWSMRVRYVERSQYPGLFAMVEDLALRAGIPAPRIGVAAMPIPNAFAFGTSLRDGRVCVTEGILKLLRDDELRAVLGHEISHLRNRDVLTITVLSVIPIVLYRLAWSFLFYGRRRERGGSTALLGLLALVFYFITNLLVLYASRIREYFADRGSVQLGNPPSKLASSLYKLAYGSARMDEESLQQVEGLKAFFVNDPSRGAQEVRDLRQLDLDKSGTIDESELNYLSNRQVRISMGRKVFELFSTHPDMLKRIKRLSEYRV